MTPLTIFSVLLATIGGSTFIHAKPCIARDLGVFYEVDGLVTKCRRDSKVDFIVPPRESLSKTQQSALCKSRACQAMIGSMDDLDLPTCDVTFDERNMTLQLSLDLFVVTCDTTTSTPAPIKRRKPLESWSLSGSGAFATKRRYANGAAAVHFASLQHVVVLAALGMLSLGLLLS